MKTILIFAIIVLGAIAQLFLPSWPLFGGMKPPILLMIALYYSLQHSTKNMWLALILSAVLQDGLDLGRFGPALLAFPIIGTWLHKVRFEIFTEGIFTQMFLGLCSALFFTLTSLFIFTLTRERPFHFGFAILRLIGSGLLGMVISPFIFMGINKLEALLPRRRGYNWQ
jgi:rod shape-determining protein MreD